MFMASSKDIGDIGSPLACNEIEAAKYWSFDINLGRIPVNLMLGFCLPDTCSKSMLNSATDKLNTLLYQAIQTQNNSYYLDNNFTITMYL